jgi:hypothetical protein
MHRLVGQYVRPAAGRTEEGGVAGVTDAGSFYVGIEIGFQVVMRRHLVALPAFFMQAHPPALAFGVIVFDPHRNDGADACEGKGHHRDQRPIAKAHEARHFLRCAIGQLDFPR